MRILYVHAGRGVGGAKISLFHLIKSRTPETYIQLALSAPADDIFTEILGAELGAIQTLYLPIWFMNKSKGAGHKLIAVIGKIRRGWYFLPVLRLAVIILKNRIDLIHTNSSATPVGALAAKLTNRPHIWHFREPVGAGTAFPFAFGDRLSAWIIQKFSEEIICISEYTAQFLRQYGIRPAIVLNGIDLRDFHEAKERGNCLREKLQFHRSTIVIGMVGSLRADWKEHELFLMAMALVQMQNLNVHFIVYGGDSNLEINDYTQKLKQMVLSLELKDRITWADYLGDIPAIMGSLDILVHPVSKEGSGRVVMEAMAAGKPVITVKAGGVQELIQHGVTGYLVEPKNAQALAAAVLKLISDPDSMYEMGQQAQSYAHDHFSHERTASQILGIYQKTLAKKLTS
jgi:glycosyltransferase involved in cell wall biosynthesis